MKNPRIAFLAVAMLMATLLCMGCPNPVGDTPPTPKTIQVVTVTPPYAFLGNAYNFELLATNGNGTYSWSVVSGDLPDGLNLGTNGIISGTPGSPGSFPFRVQASDGVTVSGTKDLSITVQATGTPVSITTASLGAIGGNISYSQTLNKSGGSGTYAWSLTSGSLPPDITLNTSTGEISGYPAKTGSYPFTVRCQDATDSTNYDLQNLSIEVTDFSWTLMVYMDGDNNLEPNAFEDLNEMEAADIRGTGIKVIVLMDGIGSYYSGIDHFSNTRLYEIQYDSTGNTASTGIRSRRLSSSTVGVTSTGNEELNMGDPAVARNFIDFCKADYSASNYSLVFWNHGSGWRSRSGGIKSEMGSVNLADNNFIPIPAWGDSKTASEPESYKAVCSDDTSGDILYTKEIGTILNGKGIGTVCMDLCLTGMIEVAYEIRNHASYLVASEEVTPGDGYEYDAILNAFKATTMTVDNFLTTVCTQFGVRYASTTGGTQSVIDLSKIDAVMSALNSFSNTLYSACTTNAVRNSVRTQIYNNAEDFYSVPGDLNIDIYDMASVISANTDYADTEAAALMTAVGNAVIHEWHNATPGASGNPRAHGLALHFGSLNSGGSLSGISTAYDKSYSGSNALSFVQNSSWAPDFTNTNGLLYRLIFETLP